MEVGRRGGQRGPLLGLRRAPQQRLGGVCDRPAGLAATDADVQGVGLLEQLGFRVVHRGAEDTCDGADVDQPARAPRPSRRRVRPGRRGRRGGRLREAFPASATPPSSTRCALRNTRASTRPARSTWTTPAAACTRPQRTGRSTTSGSRRSRSGCATSSGSGRDDRDPGRDALLLAARGAAAAAPLDGSPATLVSASPRAARCGPRSGWLRTSPTSPLHALARRRSGTSPRCRRTCRRGSHARRLVPRPAHQPSTALRLFGEHPRGLRPADRRPGPGIACLLKRGRDERRPPQLDARAEQGPVAPGSSS